MAIMLLRGGPATAQSPIAMRVSSPSERARATTYPGGLVCQLATLRAELAQSAELSLSVGWGTPPLGAVGRASAPLECQMHLKANR